MNFANIHTNSGAEVTIYIRPSYSSLRILSCSKTLKEENPENSFCVEPLLAETILTFEVQRLPSFSVLRTSNDVCGNVLPTCAGRPSYMTSCLNSEFSRILTWSRFLKMNVSGSLNSSLLQGSGASKCTTCGRERVNIKIACVHVWHFMANFSSFQSVVYNQF